MDSYVLKLPLYNGRCIDLLVHKGVENKTQRIQTILHQYFRVGTKGYVELTTFKISFLSIPLKHSNVTIPYLQGKDSSSSIANKCQIFTCMQPLHSLWALNHRAPLSLFWQQVFSPWSWQQSWTNVTESLSLIWAFYGHEPLSSRGWLSRIHFSLEIIKDFWL